MENVNYFVVDNYNKWNIVKRIEWNDYVIGLTKDDLIKHVMRREDDCLIEVPISEVPNEIHERFSSYYKELI